MDGTIVITSIVVVVMLVVLGSAGLGVVLRGKLKPANLMTIDEDTENPLHEDHDNNPVHEDQLKDSEIAIEAENASVHDDDSYYYNDDNDNPLHEDQNNNPIHEDRLAELDGGVEAFEVEKAHKR